MKRFNFDAVPGTRYWTLTIIYDLSLHEWGEPDPDFELVLGTPDGAGTGFGQRDMDWSFADRTSANAAQRSALKVINKRPGFKVHLEELEFDTDADEE